MRLPAKITHMRLPINLEQLLNNYSRLCNFQMQFGEDAQNAHFALVVDGVNPFQQNRSMWSTWPMMLLNYNLPP
jgi:hypothetical protein